jgi:hypothetical protein
MTLNQPSAATSPQGRRILVAVVTGAPGDCIQRWREVHDPEQARRLPPHATLCYWAPAGDSEAVERQVRHAFSEPVTVRLGCVQEFDNEEHTLYVQVQNTATLDSARQRLYDGQHCNFPPLREWTWHITCVRDSRNRDLKSLREFAAALTLDTTWRVDTIAYMELQGSAYAPLALWSV